MFDQVLVDSGSESNRLEFVEVQLHNHLPPTRGMGPAVQRVASTANICVEYPWRYPNRSVSELRLGTLDRMDIAGHFHLSDPVDKFTHHEAAL
ncbi:hypothetical protein H9P43_003660 [Blastocladiella emersonii ATCC 22665]|nr:hypothetical protein H9P43_003660 [Blastocladiella emersonii ATCC 22665]